MRSAVAPLYAAGFVTAFGAHSIAAIVGASSGDLGLDLLRLGFLLAVYDLAEVILKPLFGSLSDRIGAKPVIVGGLFAFAIVSLIGLWSMNPWMLVLARFLQGASASAFSPASSASVARLAGPQLMGRYFGRYGSWKSLGYTLGPLIGVGIVSLSGLPTLFATLAVVSAAAALWVVVNLPTLDPLPRPRYSVVDLVKQTTARSFLVPTLVLAASTGALGAAIGFLPALAATLDGSLAVSVVLASIVAVFSAVTQPIVGRLRDSKKLSERTGMTVGLVILGLGVVAAALATNLPLVFVAAALVGAGVGIATPCAFAHLAGATPPERMGRTMGSAEVGRELGDAGGPLLVGGVATIVGLAGGLFALAGALGAAAIVAVAGARREK